MDRSGLIAYAGSQGTATVASVGPDGGAEATLVGIAVTDRGELVFDASVVSRVVANIARDPRVALIVRWPDETVLQVQGRADVPGGLTRESCREAYFRAVPEARDRASSPEITHLRVVVDWLRPAAIPPR